MKKLGERAERILHSLIAKDGSGWYTGGGQLFNHTIFGRDVSMISLWTMHLGPEFRDAARGTIHSLSKFQGLKRNDLSEEEPGRILNEYKPYRKWRASELYRTINRTIGLVWGGTWDAELGFVGLDSTPLYVQLVSTYAALDRSVLDERVSRRDGNTVLVRQCLLEAIEWITSHRSHHGLVASRRRNPTSLFFQSWRDSHLAYLYPDGRLASLSRPVIYLEVQLACIDALRIASDLLGNDLPQEAAKWRDQADEMVTAVSSDFWLDESQMFAMALDPTRQGKFIPMPTPASSQGWMLDSTFFDGMPATQRRNYLEAILRRLGSSEFMTTAGIRARGNGADSGLGIADYHGSWTVWPVDGYKYARGLRRQGFNGLAADIEERTLMAIEKSGSFYEFFLVSPAGEVLWKPYEKPVNPPKRKIDLQILPERDLGWSVAASYLISHNIFPEMSQSSHEKWRRELEAEVLGHLKHQPPHHQETSHPFGVRRYRGAYRVTRKAFAALVSEYILRR
jgi:glycogen debranching enzyme